MKKFVENFPPSWFACTMGTGISAVVSLSYSGVFHPLEYLARFLFFFNVAFFIFLLVPWILRWFMFRERALDDLRDPVVSNFYPTIGIGMLVIAVGVLKIIGSNSMAWFFWIPGTVLTIVFCFINALIVFTGEHVKIDHINPAWFIPSVGLVVIPIAGSALASGTHGVLRDFLIVLNTFSWGAGFFLYLSLHAIALYRFILHRPLPSVLAPTVWINLGPVGAGAVSLLSLVNLVDSSLLKITGFICFLLWGLGMWWAVVGTVLILDYILKKRMEFAMSWWAFTFPLGAFISLCHTLAGMYKSSFLDSIGFVLLWVLLVIWFVVFSKSLMRMVPQ